MDERRRIIIPIGTDPESKSEQTYFDTQSRKDARPVVPLSGNSTTGSAGAGKRSRRWVLLVVILVAAVAAAGTAGVYAYMSKGREQAGPQAAVQPVAGKTLSTLPWTHTIEEPVAEENTNADDEESDAAEQERDAKADETQARNDRAANDGDPKKANKQQKRGKPGKKNADDDPDNPIKRTQDELHRIREIFEGPP